MEHLAILKGKWLSKILSGKKTIESRWYKSKKAPFGMIKKGEVVYLKGCGKPVTAKATVQNALFFGSLDEEKTKKILRDYGENIGAKEEDCKLFAGKSFCTLIFLENVKMVKPFFIDKKGYGNMAAWITTKNVEKLKA